MRIKRSEHIAINVQKSEMEKAVAYYRNLFAMKEIERTDSLVGLKGENFTLWINTEWPGAVYHEWVAQDGSKAREHFVNAGCTIDAQASASDTHGFFVTDPYGLRYHVYTAQDDFSTKTFA